MEDGERGGGIIRNDETAAQTCTVSIKPHRGCMSRPSSKQVFPTRQIWMEELKGSQISSECEIWRFKKSHVRSDGGGGERGR